MRRCVADIAGLSFNIFDKNIKNRSLKKILFLTFYQKVLFLKEELTWIATKTVNFPFRHRKKM